MSLEKKKALFFLMWPLTDDEKCLVSSLRFMSVLLMKSIYCFNGDFWMTWLWVTRKDEREFTVNWTEWHIYQVTIRLFLPSCWIPLVNVCGKIPSDSDHPKRKEFYHKSFLPLKVSSLTIYISCAMIAFSKNFSHLKVDHLS